ncbi:winged helix-turn-helix domain-containing protein [Shewanella donghaensis]|uniref:winged helix-turn-helix domain-containing protein n=1 Tax=Shewanella donghaensis TaxID=238836 RepID=UPI001182FD6C|nr:winged helix-turn-helix domain-containing protein [Shewanella donghaensis]
MTEQQPISKAHKAFLRKVYLAHLIEQQSHNLLSLQQLTLMPRRTLQDTIAAFGDVGLEVQFIQQGERHNAGFYKVINWGPINPAWVEANLSLIETALEVKK